MAFVLHVLQFVVLYAAPYPPASVDMSTTSGYTVEESNDCFQYDVKAHIIVQ